MEFSIRNARRLIHVLNTPVFAEELFAMRVNSMDEARPPKVGRGGHGRRKLLYSWFYNKVKVNVTSN